MSPKFDSPAAGAQHRPGMEIRYKPDELFRSTAPYYARHRLGYPLELFSHLAEQFALNGKQTVLDLGCGTGLIAIPMAPYVGRVLAVDPENSMLSQGTALAAQAGITNIDWMKGDSFALDALSLPELSLTTIGAAFHWMDRSAVLEELDTLTQPGGGVVIAKGGVLGSKESPWDEVIAEVRKKYLGPERRAGSGTFQREAEPHADVLRRSPFPVLETTEWNWTHDRDLDSLVGLQFSLSWSTPAHFGSESRRAEFEAELRGVLAAEFPDGIFREEITTEAIVARRPTHR